MTRIGRLAWLALVGLAVLPPGLARAEVNMKNATTAWRQEDRCAQAAFHKYPDYTAQSNAKREAARRDCLRDHRLPEPAPSAAPTPTSGAGQ